VSKDKGQGRWGVDMKTTPSDGGPLGVTSEAAHASKKHTDIRMLGMNKKPGDITLAPAYAKGTMNVRPIGTRMGWVWAIRHGALSRHAIRSAGLVRMGLATYVLGLAVGSRALFLGRGARLWRVPGVQLPQAAVSLAAVEPSEARLLADTAARVLAEAMTPKPELVLTDEANRRYRAIARALVMQRIVEAAAQGIPREPKDYAAGVSPDWDASDLMEPRYPDTQHAILLSLVLALPAKDASGLIELGALLEHRVPIVTKEAAGTMYQQACALLARLCPEWWSRAHLTEWSMVGSIEAMFRGQYCRMLNSAWAKQGREDMEPTPVADNGEAYTETDDD
jgi:hypothetical protein